MEGMFRHYTLSDTLAERVPGTHWIEDRMGPKVDLDSVARRSHCTDGTVPAHQILNSDVNIMENKQKDPFFTLIR
jgi:hypothetical protein